MKTVCKLIDFKKVLKKHHVSAYAAQTAYFIVLSFIPFIMMLFTLIQYIPSVSKSTLLTTAVNILPSSLDPMVISIIDEVYEKSGATISITAIVAAWSAGKGAMAIMRGLDTMNEIKDAAGYIKVRLKGAFYTVVFLVSIVLTLIGVVFGNRILNIVEREFPLLSETTAIIQSFKNMAILGLLILLFSVMFKYMPSGKSKERKQLPGAAFAAVSWIVFSYGFSLYMDLSSGFSNMYGSLTTIMIVFIWLYMSMYIMFMGAEINVFFCNEIDDFYKRLKNK